MRLQGKIWKRRNNIERNGKDRDTERETQKEKDI